MKAVWIKPGAGFVGNHIVVDGGAWVFDYHGYTNRAVFLEHLFRRARHYWRGWNCQLVDLPEEVLVSETLSRRYEGLWLREPQQFHHDALPRASAFLQRFPPPPR
jgi:hypothetical protein